MSSIKLAQLKRQWNGQLIDKKIWFYIIFGSNIYDPVVGLWADGFCYDGHGYNPRPFTCYELHKLFKKRYPKTSISYQNLYYHLRRYEKEGYLKSTTVINKNNRKERRFIVTSEISGDSNIKPDYIRHPIRYQHTRYWYDKRFSSAQREYDKLVRELEIEYYCSKCRRMHKSTKTKIWHKHRKIV